MMDERSTELAFRAVSLSDYDRVEPYLYAHGEGSCQHSFVSMYSLSEKYGDEICEKDGFLYTLRSRLCDEDFRVYLAPMGDGDRKAAYQNILNDAHRYGKKAKFITLTEKSAAFVEEAFPGVFDVREERDLAEYVYRTDRIAAFSGKALQRRKQEVNQFWSTYGEHAAVTDMLRSDFPDILAFEDDWIVKNAETHDAAALEREKRFMLLMFENFEAFRLRGVVLRLDGAVRGFTFGAKLSEICFDAIIEKGDRDIRHANKLLRMELAKRFAADCLYENIEEDLGISGLRVMKMSYQPEFLLQKYITTER